MLVCILHQCRIRIMTDSILNTVIIGSGPAGCTAAIYAARAGLKPVLITGSVPGGQLITTPEIGNWPGAYETPSGFDLMERLQKHAKDLGTEFINDQVTAVDAAGEVKTVTLSSGTVLQTRTIIVGTGASARYLGCTGEEEYKGKGVSACATCDGFFFRKKDVAVVGGGSAAFVEALFLANMCRKVYLVHRREGFRAEQIMIDRFKELVSQGKAEFVLNAVVEEVMGDGNGVTGLKLKNTRDGSVSELAVSGVFAAIGHDPQTAFIKGQVEMDKDGYIKTGFGGRDTATSVPGVFAAGDCADREYRQAITSAGTGCKAALDAMHFLTE